MDLELYQRPDILQRITMLKYDSGDLKTGHFIAPFKREGTPCHVYESYKMI